MAFVASGRATLIVCVIIDNNVAARVLLQEDPDFDPVRHGLSGASGRHIRIAYGGKVREELFRNTRIRLALENLDRAGRATVVPASKIEEEQRALINSGLCTSNDVHVIALARAAPARVLISLDQDLHRDFKNPRILNNPRGRVYQKRQHARLLNTPCDMPNH